MTYGTVLGFVMDGVEPIIAIVNLTRYIYIDQGEVQ